MISVLEKRYALRKGLKEDLDLYLKKSKENPEYQLNEDLERITSGKIQFYADLTKWFYKVTMEIQDPLKLRVFHLRYNMGFEMSEIADGLCMTTDEIEMLIGKTEQDLLQYEWFR
ncbi:hypothetical protein ACVELQ_001932 [Listeria monocytogenes]|nr:hypothetical protein [Listeria monocytogenes]EAE3050745.1 hypothetical protein [Listeria monocytogenes]